MSQNHDKIVIVGFMGYSSYVHEIITSSPLKDEDDDQLFYTKVYLDDELRVSEASVFCFRYEICFEHCMHYFPSSFQKKWTIKLDHKAEIFQNLNGAVGKSSLVICHMK